MTVTIFEERDDSGNRLIVIQAQDGQFTLDEAEARELCGKLPHVLDPITPPELPDPSEDTLGG